MIGTVYYCYIMPNRLSFFANALCFVFAQCKRKPNHDEDSCILQLVLTVINSSDPTKHYTYG